MEKKAIKETVLAFLEEKHHWEATKAVTDGDGVSLATSMSPAAKSSAAGMARTGVEDRVDA